ncbi:unnamed protein product [Phaeothamnion confervicola]
MLEQRGVLGQVKARIRAEVFRALEGPADAVPPPPPLSNENLLINELVREYLAYNRYDHAASVLMAESGQPSPDDALNRDFVRDELGLAEFPACTGIARLPLLYGIVSALKQRRHQPPSVSGAVEAASEYGETRGEGEKRSWPGAELAAASAMGGLSGSGRDEGQAGTPLVFANTR